MALRDVTLRVRRRRRHVVLPGPLAILASVLGAACNRHVFSPPARVLPIESANTARPGMTGVAVETGPSAAVFGPELWSGSVRVRRGVGGGTDLVLEGVVLVVTTPGSSGAHPGVYAARAGLKREVAAFAALTGGVGGGGSAAGGFVSPDVGGVIAWENACAVPLIAARGYVSQPVLPQTVDFGTNDGGPDAGRPKTTVGATVQIGMRIPLGPKADEKGSLGATLGYTPMRDESAGAAFFSAAVGGEGWF